MMLRTGWPAGLAEDMAFTRQGGRGMDAERSARGIAMTAKYAGILKIIGFAAVWTVIGCIFALPYVLRGGGFNALFAVMVNWQLWGLLAPVIRAFDARLPDPRARWRLWIAAHLIFGIVLSAVYVAIAATLEYALGFNDWNPWQQPVALLDWFLWSLMVYALITGVWQAIKYYRHHLRNELRIERLERRFAEARLQALRAQLDPHFLFNALNGISADVERDPKTARRMIEHLADLLRLSLKAQNAQMVPVGEELAFLDAYVALQKMRFGERISFDTVVAPEARALRMPSVLLQPLVENAVRHGIGGRVKGGRIWVALTVEGGDLVVRVEDDGVGLPAGWSLERAGGIGLSATRERLLALYPAGVFSVRPRPEGGVIAETRLPFAQGQGATDAA